jgi:hypothetical protein
MALLAAIAATVAASASPAAAAPLPDASCPAGSPSETYDSAGTSRSAQIFTAQNTGALTTAQIDVDKYVSSTPGDWIVSVNALDASGAPTDTMLASTSVPDASVPNGVSTITAHFAAPAAVAAGQQYALVLTRPASDVYGHSTRTDNPCPGILFESDTQTGPFPETYPCCDMVFAVFVEPEPPAKAVRSLTLNANKNKVKEGKKVTLSGGIVETRQDGVSCAANQAVELQRKKPSQTTFTTVELLQTDAAGSFSAKEKVKKTFEYRVQVPETATCDDGLSNTEKVKVKKKR